MTTRLTLVQLNPTVGDIDGNAELARDAWRAAREAGADMVALTECSSPALRRRTW